MTRDHKIVAALDQLEAALPKLIADHPDEGDFWSAFAGEAHVIVDGADPADANYASGRVDCILKNAGLIPGEDDRMTELGPGVIPESGPSVISPQAFGVLAADNEERGQVHFLTSR